MHGVGFIGAIIIGVFAGWIAEPLGRLSEASQRASLAGSPHCTHAIARIAMHVVKGGSHFPSKIFMSPVSEKPPCDGASKKAAWSRGP